jgi:hypothetical protein
LIEGADTITYLGAAFTDCKAVEELEVVAASGDTPITTFNPANAVGLGNIKTLVWGVEDTAGSVFSGLIGLETFKVTATQGDVIADTVFPAGTFAATGANTVKSFTTLIIDNADQTEEALFADLPETVTKVIIGVIPPVGIGNPTGITLGADSTSAGTLDPFFKPGTPPAVGAKRTTGVLWLEFTGVIGDLYDDVFDGLTELTVGINVRPSGKFTGRDFIETVKLGKDVPVITAAEFDSADLKRIDVDINNRNLANLNSDGILYGKNLQTQERVSLIQLPIKNEVVNGKYEVPEGIRSIGSGAIGANEFLSELTIASTVTSIGDDNVFGAEESGTFGAPGYVAGLQKFTYSAINVLSVGTSTHESTIPESTPELVITEGVKAIPPALFASNTGVKNLVIPSSVTSFAYNNGDTDDEALNAFSSTNEFVTILFKAELYTGIDIFKGITTIKDVVIAEGVRVIQDGMFENTTGLVKNMTIPSTVTEIRSTAFKGSGINSVLIPSGVAAIRAEAFVDCANLGVVIFGGSNTTFVEGFAGTETFNAIDNDPLGTPGPTCNPDFVLIEEVYKALDIYGDPAVESGAGTYSYDVAGIVTGLGWSYLSNATTW